MEKQIKDQGQIEEKRKYPRKDSSTLVDCEVQDRTYKYFIKNISENGVFIETEEPLAVGQDISITIPMPNQQEHTVTGEIIRTSPEGIGVRFKALIPDAVINLIVEAV